MEYFTPVECLLKNSELYPNKIFLHQPVNRQWQQFTWADVEHQARCIANGLKEQGFQQGDNIGILSKNCAQWLIADMAIMMAGMICVPIYATADKNTIRYIIKHADLKALFVGKLDDISEAEDGLDDILRIAFPYPTTSAQVKFSDWLSAYSPLDDIHQPLIDDFATIVYTSGSTGEPKGVALTHKNFASVAQSLATNFKMTKEDRAISYLPLAHIVERSNSYVALYVGMEVYFVESLETFLDDLHIAKPTIFISVPRLWTIFQSNVLAKMPQSKLDFLLKLPLINRLVGYKIRKALGIHHAKYFLSGTAPIPLTLLNWYEKLGITIIEGWGMTETSGASCMSFPFSKQSLGSIGKPLACVNMKLSAEGEILISGDAVFQAYYLDTEATNESFIDGWFRTGDSAVVNANGEYKIIGRIKDKFKTSKGKYVTPVPIESLLSANSDIEQVCVVGIGLKQPIALIVLTDIVDKRVAEVTDRLKLTLLTVNETLESHQKLDYLLICEESWSINNALLTPSMKIKRNKIEDKYNELIARGHSGDVLFEEDLMSQITNNK